MSVCLDCLHIRHQRWGWRANRKWMSWPVTSSSRSYRQDAVPQAHILFEVENIHYGLSYRQREKEKGSMTKCRPGGRTTRVCEHVCVCLSTLCVAAGLCESLAVSEQSDPRHCDSQHAAILTGFILRQNQQTHQWSQRRGREAFSSISLSAPLSSNKLQ